MLYKRSDLENFSKFTDKDKKQSSRVALSKDVLKNFVKFTDKHQSQSLLIKLVQWPKQDFKVDFDIDYIWVFISIFVDRSLRGPKKPNLPFPSVGHTFL